MTRWRRLHGDTDRFAIEVGFDDDPDPRAVPAHLALSWGSLALWVDGRQLCAHRQAGETHQRAHWYLRPLFEWLIDAWDALLHEQQPPFPSEFTDGWDALERFRELADLDDSEDLERFAAWQTWRNRHALRSARRGGLLPDVVIRRQMGAVEVSWGTNPLPGQPDHYRFLETRGRALLDPAAVADPLRSCLADGLAYLEGRAVAAGIEHPYSRLLSRVEHLTDPDRQRSRLAWLAGMAEKAWNELRHLMGDARAARAILEPPANENNSLIVAGSCHAAVLFGSMSPRLSTDDRLDLARDMAAAWSPERPTTELDGLARRVPAAQTRPWLSGYDTALELLEELGESTSSPGTLPIDEILSRLGVRVVTLDLDDSRTRGAAFVSPQHQPTIIVNQTHIANRTAAGRRFTLCHELCHLLYDRGAGQALSLASGPWTNADLEKRANAFAAMLLMPRDAVKSLARPTDDIAQRVSRIASTFGVGFRAALDHATNLGVVGAEEREQLVDESLQRLSA